MSWVLTGSGVGSLRALGVLSFLGGRGCFFDPLADPPNEWWRPTGQEGKRGGGGGARRGCKQRTTNGTSKVGSPPPLPTPTATSREEERARQNGAAPPPARADRRRKNDDARRRPRVRGDPLAPPANLPALRGRPRRARLHGRDRWAPAGLEVAVGTPGDDQRCVVRAGVPVRFCRGGGGGGVDSGGAGGPG